ncbi:MAG: hypothetical protein RMI34_08190 [Chloroherpetonaceae bacterium]|nr:hypothetical protein [Chloroherpetonaceae bacterium]MCS7210677.1 hypothetical protein [Chloroherpetonaceae bacterium]MDW8020037.1 hypothetical protein [Chloroherpetonaceae bacterium]MDW8466348.1 hypothetical protein [Chloroherpetonaceae bacterium]
MADTTNGAHMRRNNTIKLIISWSIVGIPSLWAIWQVVVKTLVLFQ